VVAGTAFGVVEVSGTVFDDYLGVVVGEGLLLLERAVA
jgi:hypothetical protein